jgi:hypothetical protein
MNKETKIILTAACCALFYDADCMRKPVFADLDRAVKSSDTRLQEEITQHRHWQSEAERLQQELSALLAGLKSDATAASIPVSDAFSAANAITLIRQLLGHKALSDQLRGYVREVVNHYKTLVNSVHNKESKNVLLEAAKLLEGALEDAEAMAKAADSKK